MSIKRGTPKRLKKKSSLLDTFEVLVGYNINKGKQCLKSENRQQNVAGIIIKTGRVFIPNGTSKGFKISHSISNYGWIFQKGINDQGYVKKRN